MAYGGPSNYKDNFGRYQHAATINIKQAMLIQAEKLLVDIGQVVADKLKEVHKANVIASYYPRTDSEQKKADYNKRKEQEEVEKGYKEKGYRLSRKTLAYKRTHTLERAIYAEVERKSRYECRAVIKIRPEKYKQPRSDGKTVTAVDVYQWLREGTKAEGDKSYKFKNQKNGLPTAINYATPPHLFELHTQIQMRGFLETLRPEDYVNNPKYRIKKGRRNK